MEVTGVGRTDTILDVEASTHARQQLERFLGLPHYTTRGPEIEGLQRALILSGARLGLDGVYGPQTEDALRGFLECELPELQLGAGIISRGGSVRERAAVRRLQHMLTILTGSHLEPDGKLGDDTRAVLIAWQQSLGTHNPSPEGVVNRDTWDALLSGVAGQLGSAAAPARPSVRNPVPAFDLGGALQTPADNGVSMSGPARAGSGSPGVHGGAGSSTPDASDGVGGFFDRAQAEAARTVGVQYALNVMGADLPTNGTWGSRTQEALREFFARDFPVLERGAGLDGLNRAEVRRIQTALNVVSRARLGVDGRFGEDTEAALTAWQRSVGDGAGPLGQVTRDTWIALLRSVTDTIEQTGVWPPDLSRLSNAGVYTRLPTDDPTIHHYKPYGYGTERTIGMVRAVAARYHQLTGMVLRVGDISQRGGGPIKDHSSHQHGLNVDLDLAFNDGRTTAEPDRSSENATWRSPAYDRDATRTIIQLIKDCNPNADILFNDRVLVREGLVRPWPNHDNHIHVQRLN